MVNGNFFSSLKNNFKKSEAGRREMQKYSSEALHQAKRAIFAFHREDRKGGETSLKESLAYLEKSLKIGQKLNLLSEGSFKAALEEYAEAEIFRQFLAREKIGAVKGLLIGEEIYLGGLCDVAGEILRQAVKSATARDFKEVQRCQAAVDEILGQLIELNLTGYLRTKYDQAKQARRKLEQIVYELSLRQK